MSAKPKTVAEEALGSLLTMPMPKTERDFRRAIIMAALIGRQIEADFAEHPNEHVSDPVEFDPIKPRGGRTASFVADADPHFPGTDGSESAHPCATRGRGRSQTLLHNALAYSGRAA